MKSFGCAGLVLGAVCLAGCGSTARDFDPSSAAGQSAAGSDNDVGGAGGSVSGAGRNSGTAGSVSHGGNNNSSGAGGASDAGGAEPSAGASAVGGAQPGAGAGGVASGGITGMAGAAPVDTTAPKVLSIVPANGAKGVASDAKIVITFSEAVDKASAQAALTTSAGTLSYAWDASSTVLTATPVSALSYATGATATSYTVQLSTGLKDLANNHSDAAFSSSFSTLRQIALKISRPVTGTYGVTDEPYAGPNTEDSSPVIGDGFGNECHRALPDFDISALPDALTSIVGATMSIPISMTNPIAGDVYWGTPFTTLGNLLVYHVYEQPITSASFNKAALSSVGTLMTSNLLVSGIKTINVLTSLQDDFTNRVARGHHSMYRVQFPTCTDNDAALDLIAIPFNDTMSIDVTYLIP